MQEGVGMGPQDSPTDLAAMLVCRGDLWRRPLAHPAHDVQDHRVADRQAREGGRQQSWPPDPHRSVVAIISSPNRHAITVTDDPVGRIARPPGEGRPGFLPVRGTGPTVSQT